MKLREPFLAVYNLKIVIWFFGDLSFEMKKVITDGILFGVMRRLIMIVLIVLIGVSAKDGLSDRKGFDGFG